MASDTSFALDEGTCELLAGPSKELHCLNVQQLALNAVQHLLDRPLKVYKCPETTCVVLFGRVAYLSTEGKLSIATLHRGVLKDYEGDLPSQVENLPVRRTVEGLRILAELSIRATVIEELATRRGLPVDLRGDAVCAWSLNEFEKLETLKHSIERALCGVSRATWRVIARDLHRALKREDAVASRSCWMLFMEPDFLDGYNRLRKWLDTSSTYEKNTSRTLITHAVSAAMDLDDSISRVDRAVTWFRAWTIGLGINKVGWRLLLNSPMRYWGRVMPHGYDAQSTVVALMIGQSLHPARLPEPRFACLARDLEWQHDLGDALRYIPPQIWRRAHARQMASGERYQAVAQEIREVLVWAADVGAALPKGARAAGWGTLRRHALSHFLTEAGSGLSPAQRTGIKRRYESEGMVAIRLLERHQVGLIAALMQNCLESLWSEIEDGRMLVYFLSRGVNDRAVVAMGNTGRTDRWRITEVKGPQNSVPHPDLTEFAEELCRACNVASPA